MNEINDILIDKELKTAFKPAVLFGTGYIVQNLLSFLATLLIAKILGVNNFGLFSLALSIAGLGSIISTFGLNIVPLKFIPVFQHRNETSKLKNFLRFIFSIQGISSITVTFILVIFARYISLNIYKKSGLILPLIALSLLIPLQRINELIGAVFQGFKKVQYRVYIQQIFAPTSRMILLLAALFLGSHFTGVFSSLYVESILTIIVALVIFRKKIWTAELAGEKSTTRCNKQEILSYSFPLFIPYIISFLMGRTDILLLGYFRDASEIGIYNIVFKLSLLVYLSLLSLNSIFAPMISELYVKNEHEKLALSYKIFTRIILYISLFAFGTLIILGPLFLRIIGPKYILGMSALVILAIGQIPNVLAGSGATLLSMTKFPRIALYNSLMQFTINIILDLILIPRYGMKGAAIATGISLLFISIVRVIQVSVFLKMHPFSFSYIKPVFSGLMAFLSVKITIWLGVSSPLLLMAVFATAFIATVLLMGVEKEEKYLFSLLRNYNWKIGTKHKSSC